MRTKDELTAFKVKQAIGSMAMEGFKVTRKTELHLLQIATGAVSAESYKQSLIAKYTQKGA